MTITRNNLPGGLVIESLVFSLVRQKLLFKERKRGLGEWFFVCHLGCSFFICYSGTAQQEDTAQEFFGGRTFQQNPGLCGL